MLLARATIKGDFLQISSCFRRGGLLCRLRSAVTNLWSGGLLLLLDWRDRLLLHDTRGTLGLAGSSGRSSFFGRLFLCGGLLLDLLWCGRFLLPELGYQIFSLGLADDIPRMSDIAYKDILCVLPGVFRGRVALPLDQILFFQLRLAHAMP